MRHVRQKIRALVLGRDGNFSVMTALIMPVLLGVAGMAIDATSMVLSKAQLQDATDAAALAVSSRLADKKIDGTTGSDYGKNFVAGRFSGTADAATVTAIKAATTVSITTTAQGSSGKSFTVAVNSRLPVPLNPLTRLIFGQQVNVAAASKTVSGYGGPQGLSMEVLLDTSGSMVQPTTTQRTKCTLQILNICLSYTTFYLTKMDAVKEAATAMFDGLDKVDPTPKFIRTGVITYANGMVGQSAMAWGTTKSRSQVNAIATPVGGTDATNSLDTATSNIKVNTGKTDTESVEQRKNGNDPVDRAIVLMTDGEMTGNSALWDSTIDNNVRLKCAAAKTAGIKIYTVAFMAPSKGQDLLKYCATTEANYYESNSVDALVAAFADIAAKVTAQPSRLTN
ncbi:TadE/TadG family type IV pilus assembly protein [Neorhizobium sp. JUb45]|uniref:vWA domain-containing protein n=1 Tax=unclassified Neorhizobium TaxID=2629175 RepID=UPI001051759D|nr:TadE/TadG family type IV pilus assembly protein [Neorhizobium sp. JUb45]TCR04990.1 Flp pilus assembly protein TadG [Neorhizobium sp. JUb45]